MSGYPVLGKETELGMDKLYYEVELPLCPVLAEMEHLGMLVDRRALADFGILLDMVGAKNATFFKEQTSLSKAGNIVEMVWSTARNLGYGRYFINATGGAITDDHEYVIKGRNIPCIDIINYDPDSKSGFGWYWHTQKDNMENIDRETLKAVGQTVLEVVYNRQKK